MKCLQGPLQSILSPVHEPRGKVGKKARKVRRSSLSAALGCVLVTTDLTGWGNFYHGKACTHRNPAHPISQGILPRGQPHKSNGKLFRELSRVARCDKKRATRHSAIVRMHQKVFEKCLDCVQGPISHDVDSTSQIQISGAPAGRGQAPPRCLGSLRMRLPRDGITACNLL